MFFHIVDFLRKQYSTQPNIILVQVKNTLLFVACLFLFSFSIGRDKLYCEAHNHIIYVQTVKVSREKGICMEVWPTSTATQATNIEEFLSSNDILDHIHTPQPIHSLSLSLSKFPIKSHFFSE